MKPFSAALRGALLLVGLVAFSAANVRGDEWVLYAGSAMLGDMGPAVRDWYGLNRLKPIPTAGAPTLHYYDQDSVASNFPYQGGIVRVWERAIVQKDTRAYKDAREEVEKEEKDRLKRKLSVLDMARIFPLAVHRATKEIRTLYEINCDTQEFFIMEGNNYDTTGDRISRETNFDMNLWVSIRPGTVMEALYGRVCN